MAAPTAQNYYSALKLFLFIASSIKPLGHLRCSAKLYFRSSPKKALEKTYYPVKALELIKNKSLPNIKLLGSGVLAVGEKCA